MSYNQDKLNEIVGFLSATMSILNVSKDKAYNVLYAYSLEDKYFLDIHYDSCGGKDCAVCPLWYSLQNQNEKNFEEIKDILQDWDIEGMFEEYNTPAILSWLSNFNKN